MEEQLKRIEAFNRLIRMKATGSPAELASKFDISVSLVKKTIRCMRDLLHAPIEYCRRRRSYIYLKQGDLKIGFEDNKNEEILAAIKSMFDQDLVVRSIFYIGLSFLGI